MTSVLISLLLIAMLLLCLIWLIPWLAVYVCVRLPIWCLGSVQLLYQQRKQSISYIIRYLLKKILISIISTLLKEYDLSIICIQYWYEIYTKTNYSSSITWAFERGQSETMNIMFMQVGGEGVNSSKKTYWCNTWTLPLNEASNNNELSDCELLYL